MATANSVTGIMIKVREIILARKVCDGNYRLNNMYTVQAKRPGIYVRYGLVCMGVLCE